MRNRFMQPEAVLFAVFLVLSSVALHSCKGEKKQTIDTGHKYVIPDSLMQTLLLDTVKTIPLVNSITFTGMVDVNQDNQVNIYPLVSGNATDIKVQLGDYVTAGQPLATIKSSEMAGFSNNLAIAEANVNTTKRQLDASKDLFSNGLASNVDVTVAQSNYDQAVAQLELAKRVLKINGDNKQGEWIARAPVSGFIVQKAVTNGMTIRADNPNSLFTISDLKNVWVWANVYESNIGNVHLGDDVTVTTISYPGRVFTGRVDKILNALDPASKVMKVRIIIPNEKYDLKPQMFASIIIANPENSMALSVSSKALIYDNSRYYVIVYNGHGDASITPVEVLNTLGDKTYIKAGVKDGDRVISSQAIQIYGELNS